jgi:hypothetical protein
MERYACKVLRLHARINTESIDIASPDYDEHHMVCFNEHCSIAEQQRHTEAGGAV